MASHDFQTANSYFVDEHFQEALNHYNLAIEKDDSQAEYYLKRAACHLKLNNHTDALADANSAIKLQPENPTAYFRKGVACFELEEFETAKQAFEQGQKLEPSNTNFRTWLRKCSAELNEESMETEHSSSSSSSSVSSTPVAATPAPTPEPTPTPAPAPSQAPKPTPNIRHEWYQSATFVIVSIFHKGLKKEQVQVNIQPTQLDVNIKLPDSDFVLDLDLFDRVVPEKSSFVILSTKMEIKMAKQDSVRWTALERQENALPPPRWDTVAAKPVDVAVTNASPAVIAYPTSSAKKKDWDKIAKEDAEDKLEGDEALNKVFQDIYAGGSEEQRRAMMKSFYESGGTVLSTNWNEVGKEEVKGSPPKGLEMRKWNEEK